MTKVPKVQNKTKELMVTRGFKAVTLLGQCAQTGYEYEHKGPASCTINSDCHGQAWISLNLGNLGDFS